VVADYSGHLTHVVHCFYLWRVLATLDQQHEKDMTFLEHLEELRWTFVRSFIAIGVIMVAAFVFKDFVFNKMVLAPLYPTFWTYVAMCDLSKWMQLEKALCMDVETFELQNISMAGQFMTHITVSFVAGIIGAFPYILWEIWRFIKPGLRRNEHSEVSGGVC